MNAPAPRVSSRLIAFATALTLAACGGGGGSSAIPAGGGGSTPAPTASPSAAPGYLRPTFRITVPLAGSAGGKTPARIASATQSITITLTADEQGLDPLTIPGNPASTDISGATCSSGCTVQGPLSPIGLNDYTITTHLGTGGSGAALDTWSGQFTILQGVANDETATLLGIPASISFATLPAAYAAGAKNGTLFGAIGVAIQAKDAHGDVILGDYATPITVSDPDTNGDGTQVNGSGCPGSYPTGNPAVAPTSRILTASNSSSYFCYGGIAENRVTLTASAGAITATQDFFPVLNAPAYTIGSGTPSSVVVGSSPPDVQLFATSGLGSTASVTYTEAGWTDAPYDQTLFAAGNGVCTVGGPFFIFATATPVYDVTGTIVTIALISGPTPGACPVPISDHVNDNPHPTSAVLNASYSTTGFGINSTLKNR